MGHLVRGAGRKPGYNSERTTPKPVDTTHEGEPVSTSTATQLQVQTTPTTTTTTTTTTTAALSARLEWLRLKAEALKAEATKRARVNRRYKACREYRDFVPRSELRSREELKTAN